MRWLFLFLFAPLLGMAQSGTVWMQTSNGTWVRLANTTVNGNVATITASATVDTSVVATVNRMLDSLGDVRTQLSTAINGKADPDGWVHLTHTADTTSAQINGGLFRIGGLEFNMTANGIYDVEGMVTFGNVAATTTGFALGFRGPAASVAAVSAQIPNAADGVGGEWQGWLNGQSDSTISSATPVTSSYFTAYYFGRIFNGANAGAFQLTWRAEAAANVTVRFSTLNYKKQN